MTNMARKVPKKVSNAVIPYALSRSRGSWKANLYASTLKSIGKRLYALSRDSSFVKDAEITSTSGKTKESVNNTKKACITVL